MSRQSSRPARKPAPAPARFRHQFDTSEEERQLIDDIRRRAKLRSYSDVLRTGIRILDWYLRQKEEGYSIQIVKDGDTKVVELLW